MTDSTAQHSGLQGLAVWSKAKDFAVFVCSQVLSIFPDEEKYALKSQLRRSAQSIPANIAEGYGRFYYQEGVRFAYIARGSLEETFSHLTYAKEMSYISEIEFSELKQKIDELRRMIQGYIGYLKKSRQGVSESGGQYFINEASTDSL